MMLQKQIQAVMQVKDGLYFQTISNKIKKTNDSSCRKTFHFWLFGFVKK